MPLENMEPKKLPFYLVATPIGNLEDISYRAVRILSEVDVILCEDTRVTKKLLAHYGITTPTKSYHAHSSEAKTSELLRQIVDEKKVFALVSDAGTPTISDPGVKLVHELNTEFSIRVDVISIPGPTALITALSTSGFMGNQFRFYGFLPQKKGRKQLLEEILQQEHIAIFYESSHRVVRLFEYLVETYPELTRRIYLARELTKLYEEKVLGTAQEILNFLKENPQKVRGEFVVVFDKK